MQSIILLVVGILTIVVGISMMRDSRYEKSDFDNYMLTIKPSDNSKILDWTNAKVVHNAKIDQLSQYGFLVLAYGLVVSGLSIYSLSTGNKGDNPIILLGISFIGFIMVILSLTVKQIKSPSDN